MTSDQELLSKITDALARNRTTSLTGSGIDAFFLKMDSDEIAPPKVKRVIGMMLAYGTPNWVKELDLRTLDRALVSECENQSLSEHESLQARVLVADVFEQTVATSRATPLSTQEMQAQIKQAIGRSNRRIRLTADQLDAFGKALAVLAPSDNILQGQLSTLATLRLPSGEFMTKGVTKQQLKNSVQTAVTELKEMNGQPQETDWERLEAEHTLKLFRALDIARGQEKSVASGL